MTQILNISFFKAFLGFSCIVSAAQAALISTAFAQDSVRTSPSLVQIEQIGIGNFTTISAERQNTVTVNQQGKNNTADITVVGDENRLELVQNSGGAANTAAINQSGQFNTVTLTQDATTLVDGLANQAEINQFGGNNSAAVTQTALAAGTLGFNNSVLINQTGDGNLANSTQLGVNNRSEQVQTGDNNSSEILQTGNDNLAIHRQFGSNLNVPSALGGIVIEQTGGASILIEQYSPDTAPLPK